MRPLVVLAFALAACGGSTPPPKAASKHQGILRYYPFENGMQWSYMVYGAPGTPGLLKVDKVVAFDGKVAVVQSGDASLSYTIKEDGIVREPSHAYLLKWPIQLGDKWPGAKGSSVEVTRVDAKVALDAGSFEECVETTETSGGDAAGILKTTFCPEVGPVLVEVRELNAPPGEVPQIVIAKLRAFGPAMNIAPSEK